GSAAEDRVTIAEQHQPQHEADGTGGHHPNAECDRLLLVHLLQPGLDRGPALLLSPLLRLAGVTGVVVPARVIPTHVLLLALVLSLWLHARQSPLEIGTMMSPRISTTP